MTDPDLEMTKLCAEAMGLNSRDQHGVYIEVPDPLHFTHETQPITYWMDYNPLHNDAQAIALVKHLRLDVFAVKAKAGTPLWEVLEHEDANLLYSNRPQPRDCRMRREDACHRLRSGCRSRKRRSQITIPRRSPQT